MSLASWARPGVAQSGTYTVLRCADGLGSPPLPEVATLSVQAGARPLTSLLGALTLPADQGS